MNRTRVIHKLINMGISYGRYEMRLFTALSQICKPLQIIDMLITYMCELYVALSAGHALSCA